MTFAVRPAAFIDLNVLVQRDPVAARLGALACRGQMTRLAWDDFVASAPLLLRAHPFPSARQGLQRLQNAFFAHPISAAIIAPRDVAAVGTSPGVDTLAAVTTRGDTTYVVGEAFDAAFSQSRPWLSWSRGDAAFTPPKALDVGGDKLVGSLAFVRLLGRDYLYFASAPGLAARPTLWRAELVGDTVAEPERLPDVPGVATLTSWPRWKCLDDGRVALAFRDDESQVKLALSADGRVFDAATAPPCGFAMAEVGSFADGTLVFTGQTGFGGEMTSHVSMSRDDGKTWSAPQRITDACTNVHDTTVVRRRDGGVDLYYIYSGGRGGFSLYRRSLGKDGALGPEQRVTGDALGNVTKPSAHRVPGGALALTWAESVATGQQARFAVVANDAPLPLAAAKKLLGGGITMPGTAFATPEGGSVHLATQNGMVVAVHTSREGVVSEPRNLAPGAVSGATHEGRTYAFLFQGDVVQRSELTASGLSPGTPVRLHGNPRIAWPQMTTTPTGRIVLAFNEPQRAPYVSVSDDGGERFSAPVSLAHHTSNDRRTLAHVGCFADGTLVLTTQVADAAWRFKSYVRTSRDGKTWSAPVQVSQASDNIHDAFPANRADGGVDLYYLVPQGQGFSAYRRRVSPELKLGPEERVTDDSVGAVEKPQARRLTTGELVLTYARRNGARMNDYDLMTLPLAGDAP